MTWMRLAVMWIVWGWVTPASLNAFTAGDPAADCNGDGTINSQDFTAFLNAFVAGC